MTKILEWLFSGPKIIGEVEQFECKAATDVGGANPRAEILLLIYIVNKRIKPTTIRGFTAQVRIVGKWTEAKNLAVPDGFRLPGRNVDFASNRLYERAALNLLEYGKGMRGWLRLAVYGVIPNDLKDCPLRIVMEDVFTKKHVLKFALKPADIDLSAMYFPEAGMLVA